MPDVLHRPNRGLGRLLLAQPINDLVHVLELIVALGRVEIEAEAVDVEHGTAIRVGLELGARLGILPRDQRKVDDGAHGRARVGPAIGAQRVDQPVAFLIQPIAHEHWRQPVPMAVEQLDEGDDFVLYRI